MTERTPGPWQECGHQRGGCVCGQIWSLTADCPIANVVSGDWGDTWPAIRPISSTIEGKYEVYTEMSVYGTVDPDVAKANAAFIVRAVNNYDRLVEALSNCVRAYEAQDRDNFSQAMQDACDMAGAIVAAIAMSSRD